MKRQLLLSLVTMFVTAVSWADVAINETNFPDENFRNYLINETSYSAGSDGVFTDAEIQNINLINVDNKDISSLKGIEFFTALKGLSCSNNQLTSLDVSRCTALTSLSCYNNQLTSLNISGCTALQTFYCGNNQLTSLDISGCTALGLLDCQNNQLTSLNISGCTALRTLFCSNNKLTSIDLSKNTQLENVDIANNPLAGVIEGSCGSNARYSLNLGTGVLSVTGTGAMSDNIENRAPYYIYRDYVKTINIANGITRIGTEAFYRCRNLTSVSIPNSVTSIGDGVFRHCDALTSFTLPNSVTEVGYGIFEDIENSPTVYNSTCFVKLKYSHSGAYTIPAGIKTIAGGAFEDCEGLTSVTMPNTVTSIGEAAFASCAGLTSITISNNVTTIEEATFKKSGLTSITIPSGVKSIGEEAFERCTSLASVTIPSSVTSIVKDAFHACNNLTSINSKIKVPFTIEENVFQYNNQVIPATLYVPVGTKSLYASTAGWSLFTNIVEKEFDDDDEGGNGGNEGEEDTDISKIDNVIYVESMEGHSGSQVSLPIMMKNTAAIRGFQFDLYLPDGVTIAVNAKGKTLVSLSTERLGEDDEHSLLVAKQEDGCYRFLCNSMYEETFLGNNGEIATATLEIAEGVEDGDYPIIIKNQKLSESDISKFYETPQVKSTLSVVSYIPGDINGDDKVDISDYIGVANYILGNAPESFNQKAADVDENGTIDISDYIGVANIILSGSIYGSQQ